MSRATEPPFDIELTVPTEQVARQASASLGGHLFQAMRAASEWVQLGESARLLIEVAEDYAVLARGALAMTQIKQEFSASVTLRSDGVRKSLASLLAFQNANPALKVNLAYLTTAQPGREAQSGLRDGVNGITYWREVARGAEIAPLRQLLLETQTDEKVLEWIRSADDGSLRARLIQPVSWLTGSPALAEAKASLEARLRRLGVDRSGFADDGERALPFIIYRILQTAVNESRALTSDDFEQEWQRANTVNISVSMMRQMAAMGGGGGGVPHSLEPPPPTLPARTAPRSGLVDELRTELKGTDVLWLHGSSGLGKSLLARLMLARDNARWEFVSLKGLTEPEAAGRVRNAIGKIEREDFAGLIFDDLPVPASEMLRSWIAAASLEVSSAPSARIVVTAEREPLPQIRRAFEPLTIKVRAAPYLEEDDVFHMVTAAGGAPETWAKLLHFTCGGGHPLLIDARVAGLASKGWPAGEQLSGLGLGENPSELIDVRREVSLRLLDELSPDAHRLLLRLSALAGPFDRRLVDAVAAVEAPIDRAGALFEYLIGPWIEEKRADRYSLSPLLATAATSLGDEERNRVYAAAIKSLTKRKPFPADLLSALAIYSMVTRDLAGLMFLGTAVVNSPDRAAFAHELYPLIFMKSGEGGLLVPEHPGVSAILRTAQVFAAVNSDPPSMVEKVVNEALAEAAAHSHEELRGANTFTTLTAALAGEGADLAPKVWMPLLVMYHEHRIGRKFPTEMTEHLAGVDLGGLTAEQFFFMIRSNKVDSVADVEELFGELDHLEGEFRHSLLIGAPTLLKGPPLFVQKGWSSETTPFTLDAAGAEIAYARMADLAIAWGEKEIAIECIRSRAVMLDEYLSRHEQALAVLDAGAERFGRNERLIRSRATVLATMGRHVEELELLSTLDATYSEDEPLERMLMLRMAAISAAKLEEFGRSAQFFQDSFSAANEEGPQTLSASVKPGLLTDAAIMHFCDGRLAEGISNLVKALLQLSADHTDDPSLPFAYAAITHIAQWATAQIEQRPFPEDPSKNPGICSTLKPKFDPEQYEPRKLHQEWYLLARLEAAAGLALGVEAKLHDMELANGVQVGLALGVGATQMQHFIERGDAGGVLQLLPRYAWLSGLVASSRADTVSLPSDETKPDKWSQTEALAARPAVAALLAILIIGDRLDEALQAARQAREVSLSCSMLLPEAEGETVLPPEIFASGLAALRLLTSPAWLNAEDLLRKSVDLFTLLKFAGISGLNIRAHGILRERWLHLVNEHRVILSNPRLSVPEIEAAAAREPGIAGVARLIEAGRLGASLGLAKELVEILKATR